MDLSEPTVQEVTQIWLSKSSIYFPSGRMGRYIYMMDNKNEYGKGYSTPRQHHTVPGSYLKGFVHTEGDRLALYDRERRQFRSERPGVVARQRDYYAYETQLGKKTIAVEEYLERRENAGMRVINKIDSGAIDLTFEERVDLAFFAALQHTRIPAFAEIVADFDKVVHDALKEENFYPLGDPHQPDLSGMPGAISPAELMQHIEDRPSNTRNAHIEAMLSSAQPIAEILLKQQWVIVRRPSIQTAFITSDKPFCLMPRPGLKQNAFMGVGVATPGIDNVLPLSSSSVLVSQGPGVGIRTCVLSRDDVRRMNQSVALNCQHYIFGRDVSLIKRIVVSTGIDKKKWREEKRVDEI